MAAHAGQWRCIANVTSVQAKIEPSGELEGVYTLTLDRPEAKNSLGHQLMRQLREALAAFTDKQARCLLITSAVDNTFCAGADLKVCTGCYLRMSNHAANAVAHCSKPAGKKSNDT